MDEVDARLCGQRAQGARAAGSPPWVLPLLTALPRAPTQPALHGGGAKRRLVVIVGRPRFISLAVRNNATSCSATRG